MSDWKALGGRVSLFPVAPTLAPPPSALDLYRRAWGGDPDIFQKQPNPLVPTVAQARRGHLMAGCIVQPGRIDFTFTPPTLPDAAVNLIEETGELHAELLYVTDVISRQLVPNSVVRVAVNVQFFSLQASFAEANKALTAVIPGRYGVKVADEEDFVFQINSPYPSQRIKDIRMNSLVKWSVDRLQVFTLSVPVGGSASASTATPAPAKPQTANFIGASITLDNNNVPGEKPLSSGDQSSLLSEALSSAAQTQQEIGLNVEGFKNASLFQ